MKSFYSFIETGTGNNLLYGNTIHSLICMLGSHPVWKLKMRSNPRLLFLLVFPFTEEGNLLFCLLFATYLLLIWSRVRPPLLPVLVPDWDTSFFHAEAKGLKLSAASLAARLSCEMCDYANRLFTLDYNQYLRAL